MLQASVQTRRSREVINTENFDGILKCLSNRNSAKNVIKKISSEVVQLLLAYALQVSTFHPILMAILKCITGGPLIYVNFYIPIFPGIFGVIQSTFF